MLHGADADAGSLVGNLRAQHKLSGLIIDNFVLCLHDLDVGIALLECRKLVLLSAPCRNQHAAAALYGANHAVDVIVAHAANGESDGVFRFGFGLLTCLDSFMNGAISAGRKSERCLGKRSQHSCGTHCLEKRTPVQAIILHLHSCCLVV